MQIKLEDIRTNRGMTQAELAEASGVTRQTISRIENERCKEIGVKTLLMLCDALNCSITDLICP